MGFGLLLPAINIIISWWFFDSCISLEIMVHVMLKNIENPFCGNKYHDIMNFDQKYVYFTAASSTPLEITVIESITSDVSLRKRIFMSSLIIFMIVL